MIEFPATWVLYGFYVLGGGLVLLAAAYALHGLRHGARMPLIIMSTGIYLIGALAIVWTSWTLLASVDWSGTFTVMVPTFDFVRFGL
jgi:hypothetical protein